MIPRSKESMATILPTKRAGARGTTYPASQALRRWPPSAHLAPSAAAVDCIRIDKVKGLGDYGSVESPSCSRSTS